MDLVNSTNGSKEHNKCLLQIGRLQQQVEVLQSFQKELKFLLILSVLKSGEPLKLFNGGDIDAFKEANEVRKLVGSFDLDVFYSTNEVKIASRKPNKTYGFINTLEDLKEVLNERSKQ